MEDLLIFGTTQIVTAHQEIKATLDQGNLDYFGMTSGYDFDTEEIQLKGHTCMDTICITKESKYYNFHRYCRSFDFPNGDSNSTRPDWDTFASDNGFNSIQEFYDYYINKVIHKEIVDELAIRISFYKNIYHSDRMGYKKFSTDESR